MLCVGEELTCLRIVVMKFSLTQKLEYKHIFSLRRGEPQTSISINFSFVVASNSLRHGKPVNGLSINFLFAVASNSLCCGECLRRGE